ncbi:asparagine synthetase B [Chlorella sorokiniana]|uniref:Asparagine synthetase B n=1 Tax=Chlorella sorokiniana TaxID=3076 RepID=A0A2P6TVE9_CHLSO|nr:asparagine synthetase B [Chlorella sorokiniana]|eukprot:PRW58042.1 asparagine synthetase B [Chlorella sorokiniana]
MWRAAALLVVLAVLAAHPAAGARDLQGLESSLPGGQAPASVQARGFWRGTTSAAASFGRKVVDAAAEEAGGALVGQVLESQSDGSSQGISPATLSSNFANNVAAMVAQGVGPAMQEALASQSSPTTADVLASLPSANQQPAASASAPDAIDLTLDSVVPKYLDQLYDLHFAKILQLATELRSADGVVDGQRVIAGLNSYLLVLQEQNYLALKEVLDFLAQDSQSSTQATTDSPTFGASGSP